MRVRANAILGILFLAAGCVALAWALVVWQWRDPFTSLYTAREQQRLSQRYAALAAAARPTVLRPGSLARTARLYRLRARRGDPIGRLRIARLDLAVVVVNGTDSETLESGPGRDLRSFMPGEAELVYLAGHRTTYLAPFARIDEMRNGDLVSLETPYALFTYAVTGHRIVDDSDLSVLRSPGRETLRLQACHPRFFATQRYIVFARLISVDPVGTARQGLA